MIFLIVKLVGIFCFHTNVIDICLCLRFFYKITSLNIRLCCWFLLSTLLVISANVTRYLFVFSFLIVWTQHIICSCFCCNFHEGNTLYDRVFVFIVFRFVLYPPNAVIRMQRSTNIRNVPCKPNFFSCSQVLFIFRERLLP